MSGSWKPIPGVRYADTVSMDKVCPKCVKFCKEIMPIFPKGGAAMYFRLYGALPQSTVYCPRGCSNAPGWGWKDLMDKSINRSAVTYG